MERLYVAGAVLLALFSGIAMVDGSYFHIIKYKLHTRPESRTEHLTHTLNAFLFPPMVYLLLYRPHAGAALWAAVFVVAADVAVESWDVFIEKASRESLGGLTPTEYWVHVMAITLRVAGIAVLFAARPVAAWSLSAPLVLGADPPGLVRIVALVLMGGGAFTALQHAWLLQPRYVRRPASA